MIMGELVMGSILHLLMDILLPTDQVHLLTDIGLLTSQSGCLLPLLNLLPHLRSVYLLLYLLIKNTLLLQDLLFL